jgi:hypothetical protein
MFRRSPLLGAAAVYGVSKAAARRENEREFDRPQQMESEIQGREMKRQEDERTRRAEQEEERRRVEREEERRRAEQEEEQRRIDWGRERLQQLTERQSPGQPVPVQAITKNTVNGPEPNAMFYRQCGNSCRQVDKFCSRCGTSVTVGVTSNV